MLLYQLGSIGSVEGVRVSSGGSCGVYLDDAAGRPRFSMNQISMTITTTTTKTTIKLLQLLRLLLLLLTVKTLAGA